MIRVRRRAVHDRQLHLAHILDVVRAASLVDRHHPLVRQQAGRELAGQQHDQPRVQHDDPDPLARQLEPHRMRRHQVQHQQARQQESAGEGEAAGHARKLPRNEELQIDPGDRAAKVAVDRLPDALVHLCQRPRENQEHGGGEQRHRQLQGGQAIQQDTNGPHGASRRPAPNERAKSKTSAAWASATAGEAWALTNQVRSAPAS